LTVVMASVRQATREPPPFQKLSFSGSQRSSQVPEARGGEAVVVDIEDSEGSVAR
jgi:hypothetical protein